MSGRSVKRVTLSLPPKVVSDLDFVSSRMGISRSALVSSLLSGSLPSIIPLVTVVTAAKDGNGGEAEAKRYMGDFAASLDEQMKRLNSGIEGLEDDLFAK